MSFSNFGSGPSQQPIADINTTPLVDVMLVLLIIFIVTAPLMTQAIQVNLPNASGDAADQKPETIRLALDASGKLHWNNEAIDDVVLAQRLTEAATKQPQPELHLAADKDTRYQRLAEVMGATRTAGLTKLGFVTLPGGAHESPRQSQ